MWIEITVAAAFLQNFRSALQKRLKGQLSTTGATFVRFGFGFPFALLYLLSLHGFQYSIPPANPAFLWSVLFASLSQIAGTALLVLAFSYRSFMAATVYSKTEPIIAAIFGFVILGDGLSLTGLTAIAIGLVGVFALSVGKSGPVEVIARSTSLQTVVIGLGSGIGFAFAAIGIRAATMALDGENVVPKAALTLVYVLGVQTLLMSAFMAVFERTTFRAIQRAWRTALLTGLCGAAASVGWFTAMAMQPVALVKTVGQIELVFAYIASVWWFRETISRAELSGCGLVILSVIILIQFG